MQREGITADAAIHLDRPNELIWELSVGRYQDSVTGVIYHPKYNPPPQVLFLSIVLWEIPKKSSKLSAFFFAFFQQNKEVLSRLTYMVDDNAESLERRLRTFDEKTMPILGKDKKKKKRTSTW